MVGNGPETCKGASGSVVTRETMPGAGRDAERHPLQFDLKFEASLRVSVSNTGLPNRRMAHGPSHKFKHFIKHLLRLIFSNFTLFTIIASIIITTHFVSQWRSSSLHLASALASASASHPIAQSKKAANLNFKSDIKISQILQPRRLIDVEFCHEFNAIDFNQIGQELAEILLFLHSLCTRCSFGFAQKAANLNFKSDIKISQISQPRSLIGVEFRPESNAIDFNQIGQEMAKILFVQPGFAKSSRHRADPPPNVCLVNTAHVQTRNHRVGRQQNLIETTQTRYSEITWTIHLNIISEINKYE
jgi:hypothetical protein